MYVVHSFVESDLRKSITGQSTGKPIIECFMLIEQPPAHVHYKQQEMTKVSRMSKKKLNLRRIVGKPIVIDIREEPAMKFVSFNNESVV